MPHQEYYRVSLSSLFEKYGLAQLYAERSCTWEESMYISMLIYSKALQFRNILNEDNLARILQQDTQLIADISTAYILLPSDLQTQSNLDLFFQNHESMSGILNLLFLLSKVELIDENNFEAVIKHAQMFSHRAFLTLIAYMKIIVPDHLLIQAFFDQIFQHCEAANGDVETVLRHIYADMAPLFNVLQAPTREINPDQSTHTTSVHQSVSKSAQNLKKHYAALSESEIDAEYQALKAWVDSLSNEDLKTQAVQHCLLRLEKKTAGDKVIEFVDPTSKVSIKTLLALAWHALHDPEQRQGALEDSKAAMLEGLYEVQRGYNLDAQGQDDGQEDSPICTVGTFSKIVNALQGVIKLAEVRYVSLATINQKFLAVGGEALSRYLAIPSEVENAADFQQTCQVANELSKLDEKAGDSELKSYIKSRLLEEFSNQYASNIEETMKEIPYLPNLPELPSQEALTQSEGYRNFCSRHLRNAHFPFFKAPEANRMAVVPYPSPATPKATVCA